MIFVKEIMIVLLLFVLPFLFPLSSFLLPVYKIKQVSKLRPKDRIIINIVVLIILGIITPILMVIYCGFYGIIELLYFYFKPKNIKTFDKIIIIAILSSAIIFLLYTINLDKINGIYNNEILLNKLGSIFKINTEQVKLMLMENSKFFSYTVFLISLTSVFLTYVVLERETYLYWDISYLWLLIFIIAFFVEKFLLINNYYIINMREIGRIIFVLYGMKSIYSCLYLNLNNAKYKFLFHLVAFFITMRFSLIAFLVGAAVAFSKNLLILKKNKD
ncbi:MAG: hypothetical protein LBT51_08095 [Fusobacteriaceae bacterium]|jgi:hypothetical protein|nr:hypothetical protein [Fusobacteriaceae bacterium]